MLRAFWFTLKLALIVLVAIWVANRPGVVIIHWLGYDITAHVGVLVVGLMVAAFFLLFLHRLCLAVLGIPAALRRRRDIQRFKKGQRALARGLAAVAAGDSRQATLQSEHVRKFLPDDRALSYLLEAQAARLRGEGEAAREAYKKLMDNKDTAFLGVRGLMAAALEEGDRERALDYARQALRVQPRQPWLIRTVYEMQLSARHWQEARETLRAAIRYDAIDPGRAASDRIAILLHEADRHRTLGENQDAQRDLKAALKLDPSFVPTVTRLAKLYSDDGKRRAAVALIEKAWKNEPHPELAALWETLAPAGKPGTQALHPGERLRWFEKLVALRPDHVESQLAAAKAALEDGLWGEARQYLNLAQQLAPSARLYRLWARLAERLGHSEEARRWLEKAADAPQGKAWTCTETGRVYDRWSAVAEPHGSFNTIRWDYPRARLAPQQIAPGASGEILFVPKAGAN
jgi:HemY protein